MSIASRHPNSDCPPGAVLSPFRNALRIATAAVLATGALSCQSSTPQPAPAVAVPHREVATPSMVAPEVQRKAPPQVTLTQVAPPVDARLSEDAKHGGEQLGSLSLGRANRGALYGAVQLKPSSRWEVMDPRHSWGTLESVTAIGHAVDFVHARFPETQRLTVGHLSRRYGGWLRPHRSHQSGRDVDIGLYYTDEPGWYRRATAENLDAPRMWALISGLVQSTDVEYVFFSRRFFQMLHEAALASGDSPELIATIFDGHPPLTRPLLRHTRGHQTHIHVRFASPVAVAAGRSVRSALGRNGRNRATAVRVLRARAKRAAKLAEDEKNGVKKGAPGSSLAGLRSTGASRGG